ncbi:E3 ubiquitin-protein ligase TRIM47-like isoform X3 [Salvelinus namaycush]|uniref:E3 ubiquitin-protein ligase TRIM47-like isoform X3 n=1 Tax=Salvelinus namaycush TaxID=8040 RepID=A0A8U0QYX9_SALNM|nr:E3 ubiquitin-protein ligase TRIM47-like isoform X3 [Salvelinus namaycush]
MSALPRCCICLDDFTSPVSIPCGHRFCLGCIGEYWRLHGACQCPLCMTCFPIRPQLKTKPTLHNVAPWEENQAALRAGEVPCDICPEKRCRAVKSCLVCLASYCEMHLEPHYMDSALGRHPLVTVWKNLDEPVCRLHGRRLARFCRSDQTCVCAMCVQTDHRGHRVVTIAMEATKKKVKLKKSMMKFQQMIQERLKKMEDLQQSVELVEVTEEKQKAAERRAEGFVKEMEQEITELQRRSTELEQLSHTEDHLTLLQALQ